MKQKRGNKIEGTKRQLWCQGGIQKKKTVGDYWLLSKSGGQTKIELGHIMNKSSKTIQSWGGREDNRLVTDERKG